MSVSSKIYRALFPGSQIFLDMDPGLVLIEVLVLAGLVAIALRANRMYTLWMAGFQLIALMAHFARGMADAISQIAYVIMYVGPSYLQIITLALGIWLHRKRVLRHGSYRSWRASSPPSQASVPTN